VNDEAADGGAREEHRRDCARRLHDEAAERRNRIAIADAAYPLATARQYAVFACQGGGPVVAGWGAKAQKIVLKKQAPTLGPAA
jgi:hypothetical protein